MSAHAEAAKNLSEGIVLRYIEKLEAENQRLQTETQWNHLRVHELEDSVAGVRAENQRLRDALLKARIALLPHNPRLAEELTRSLP